MVLTPFIPKQDQTLRAVDIGGSSTWTAVLRAVVWAKIHARANRWRCSPLTDRLAQVIEVSAVLFVGTVFGLTSGWLTYKLASQSRWAEFENLSSFLFLATLLGCSVSCFLRNARSGAIRPRALRHLALTDGQLWSVSVLDVSTSGVSVIVFGVLIGHFLGVLVARGASALWLAPVLFMGVYLPLLLVSLSCAALLDSALEGSGVLSEHKRVTTVGLGLLLVACIILLLPRSAIAIAALTEGFSAWRTLVSALLPSQLAAAGLTDFLRLPLRPGAPAGTTGLLLGLAATAWWTGRRYNRRLLEDRPFSRAHEHSRSGWKSPLAPSLTAALVQREFRYLTRTGYGRFAILLTALLCAVGPRLSASGGPLTRLPGLSTTQANFLVVLVCSLQVLALASNAFGWDGRGAIAFSLGSVSAGRVLVAKNLTTLLLAQVPLVAELLITKDTGLRPFQKLVIATGFEAYLVASLVVFNWMSVAYPRSLSAGRLGSGGGASSSSSVLFLVWITAGAMMIFPLDQVSRIGDSNGALAAALLALAGVSAAVAYRWAFAGCARRLESDSPAFLAKLLGETA
ncbi:MAG: hypothetical protein ACRD1B_08775 [Thermoanaerobaculia bacterium]